MSPHPHSLYRPFRWGFIAAVFVLGAGFCLIISVRAERPRGADTVPPETAVVELPVFEVNDTRVLPPPEVWFYATLPGFEVLSSLSARETQRSLRDFALLQAAIEVIMPGLQPSLRGPPTTLVLCGRGNEFGRFVPGAAAAETYRTNSLFLPLRDRTAIVINRRLTEIEIDGGALTGFDPGATALPVAADEEDAPGDETDLTIGATYEIDPTRAFYQEYFRHLIRTQSGSDQQGWFEEGMARLLAAIDFNARRISFAQVGDGFGGSKGTDFGTLLSQRALIPLDEMFAYPPGKTDQIWSAQCYAFVHLCLYGRNQRYQSAFLQFIARSSREPVTAELFMACFGQSFKTMASELRSYLEFTDHQSIQFNARQGQTLPEPPAIEVRAATDAESGRIVGEILAAGAHPEAAGLALVAPYQRGARDPRLLAALGLYAVDHQDHERARKYLTAAADLGVDRTATYLELSRLQLAHRSARLTAAETDAALTPLLQARGRAPLSADWFEQLATLRERSGEPPSAEQIAWINEGLERFPQWPRLLVAAARVNLRWGTTTTARQIISYGLQVFTQPAVLTLLQDLERQLPALPPAAGP